jgi:hypothetical protein
MATLQSWHDFFILTGTAAATLLGLVFVAASIAATVPNEKLGDDRARQLWVLPIVWAFVRVLVVSAMGVIPGQTPASFGYILLVLAIGDLGRMPAIFGGMRRHHLSVERLSPADWWWYVVLPCLSTLAVAVSGLALARQLPFPAQVLAGGMLGHLVVGVHNAWELADWLATRQ